MASRTVYTFKGEVEYRIEKDSGWTLNRATRKLTPFVGLRFFYRAPGERLWRKRVLVPDESLGQTVRSLRDDAPEIALSLLRAAGEEDT